MNIILLEPIKNLGEAGKVVKVRPGYARNYLIPQGLALLATKANKAELEARLNQRVRMLAERKADAERLKELIGDGEVEIIVKAGEGRIYGSVSKQDIANAIEGSYEVKIDRRKIELINPIKELGDYIVTYKPHSEVPIDFKVKVKTEESE